MTSGRTWVSITGYGGSTAYKLTKNISIGGALAAYTFSLDSTFRRFDINGFLGAPNKNVVFGQSTQSGTDVGFAPTIGITAERTRLHQQKSARTVARSPGAIVHLRLIAAAHAVK